MTSHPTDKRSIQTKCTMSGCAGPVLGRGYCRKHYLRWYKYGDPTVRKSPRGEALEWLERNKNFDGEGCLTWPFSRRANGIGYAHIAGKTLNAHRAMCILAHGNPPSLKHGAAHFCGKAHEGCVNPKHLRWATQKENLADRLIHGTDGRGEKNSSARLNEAAIHEIRKVGRSMPQPKVAAKFGVSRSHVGEILSGKSWGWLPLARSALHPSDEEVK